ncbi:MAG: MG2 domain-containing protein, partial [Planctomycetota bacterium]|nr:MG2 domain-containing protein [Planctomycetota bacterium]
MQHVKTLVLVAFAGAALCVAVGHAQEAKPSRAAQWKKVDDAIKKGLPQTAQKELEPIIKGAIADKAWAEAIKAIGKKLAYEGNVQGNLPEVKIIRLQAEIAKAPQEMVPVMDAILANWYWHYFQRNRWRFMQRTATAAPPGEDFKTWDLSRLFTEIDKQFTKSLSAHETLKKIPVATYDDLLQKGTMPDAYRPTLYDILVHNALQFYSSAEQAAAKAEDAFELSADSPIFSAVADFRSWKPETTDDGSPTLKAIQLYQQLLAFHADDDDQSAFIDADLLRLTFGNNKAFGEEKSARYKAALKRFAAQHAEHPISAQALFQWAGVLHGEHQSVEAHEIASRGQAKFPTSPGGIQCHNLIQQIEAKSSNVTVEWVWNTPLPDISVRYRNLKEVHFRIVSQDPMALINGNSYRPFLLDQKQNKALLGRPTVKSWSHDLPATDDYAEREETIAAPEGLTPGLYYLISSHNAQFSANDNQVKYTPFWVSNLALIMRTRYGDGSIDGFVLNAVTGEPISGATVRTYVRQRNARATGPVVKTDKNGLFKVAVANRASVLLLVEHGKDRVSSMQDHYSYQYNNQPKPSEQTIFFTDRALYRPGQTIYYKGICITVNQESDNYTVIAGRNVTVAFVDRNGKEIATQQVRTNDYGSLQGSFTAPRDRLMGRMSLVVRGGPNGAGAVTVEEYKRPKFEVKIEPPKDSPKLLAKVSVIGKATAYTGAAI